MGYPTARPGPIQGSDLLDHASLALSVSSVASLFTPFSDQSPKRSTEKRSTIVTNGTPASTSR